VIGLDGVESVFDGGQTVLEAGRQWYRLYGIDVLFGQWPNGRYVGHSNPPARDEQSRAPEPRSGLAKMESVSGAAR
jgi:hypothetical protein